MRLRPNSVKLGGPSFRSPLGPALALLVWLSPFTLPVAAERVDGRMRRMTVSRNWLEGLRSGFLTVTGPASRDAPAGWSTAKVNCMRFSGRPSPAEAASTRDRSFSSARWRSFSAAGLRLKPGACSSSMALLLMMLTYFVSEMNGF